MEKAVFCNKHTPLLGLKMEDGLVVEITKIYNKELLPILLQDNLNVKRLNKWIKKRRLPDSRDGIKTAREEFPGFEKHHCMFSLSDQYWFRYSKEETWDGLNFFTNPYDEDLGKIFFSPWEVSSDKLTSRSPDLATNGILRKRWIRAKDGTSYLLKAGSKELHQEPLSEVLASITLKRLNIIPFVVYELTVDGLKLCSRCRNFVDKNTEFVPASHIFFKKANPDKGNVYSHLLRMCEEYGIEDAKEYIDNMIAADHIIGNDDRHLGNFGFLRNVETGEVLGFAPLFDSGSAYWGDGKAGQKSKLFNRKREAAAFHAVMKRIKFNIDENHREMIALLDKYPEINKRKREEVKQRIEESEMEIENMTRLIQERNSGSMGRDL